MQKNFVVVLVGMVASEALLALFGSNVGPCCEMLCQSLGFDYTSGVVSVTLEFTLAAKATECDLCICVTLPSWLP